MGRPPSVIGQLQSYATPKDKTRRAALARSSPKPGGFWQREDLTSKRQARPSMAGESRAGRSVGHEFERGRPSVNVSAADASYAVPNSRSAPRGGNSITISTSWDVSSFGVRRRPAPQSSGAGYASSFLLSHYFANCRLLHSNDYLTQRDNNLWIAWRLMQSRGMAGILGFAAMSSH